MAEVWFATTDAAEAAGFSEAGSKASSDEESADGGKDSAGDAGEDE